MNSGASPVINAARSIGRKGSSSTSAPAFSRDRARGNISLLGSEAALLDRERGRISGRPYVIQALDLHLAVGREEPVLALWQPWQRRDLEPWQRDDPVEPERLAARQDELLAVDRGRQRTRPEA